MQAMVLTNPGGPQPLQLQERPVPEPGPGEVVVRLYAAALNRRDLGLYQGTRNPEWAPYILGSDGAGVVAAVGDGVSARTGDPVVLGSCLFCGRCRYCLTGEHSLCDHFGILGGPTDGTFAQYVRVPARNLAPKPAHLDFTAAAALPLALGTAWRALVTRAAIRPGEKVLIHGIGGGVALYCLQIAVAMGAQVIVTSGSADKLARARTLGAAASINYREEDVARRVLALTDGRGADLVVDSGGKETLPISVAASRKGGRIVHFGATTGTDVRLNARHLFGRQISLLGTSMHTQPEFDAALAFVANTQLNPVIAGVFPLREAAAAYEQMAAVTQFGKLVLKID